MTYYQTDFNNFHLDILTGQQGWTNYDPDNYTDAIVEEAIIFSGREVHLIPADPKHCFSGRMLGGFGAGGVQYLKVGFACRSSPNAFSMIAISNEVRENVNNLFIWTGGYIYVYDGGAIVSTGISFGVDEPHIVKAKIDFNTKTWEVSVDGILKLTGLDLFDANLNDIGVIGIYADKNFPAGGVMDDLFVGNFDSDVKRPIASRLNRIEGIPCCN